jgi:hypothetical protein
MSDLCFPSSIVGEFIANVVGYLGNGRSVVMASCFPF